MMIRAIFASSMTLALLAQPKTDTPKPGIATATKEARPSALPKDAVEVGSGVWKHTAADGKVWIYRRTPFGVSKQPANAAAEDAVNDEREAMMIKATEAGDSVKFERKMPFGVTKWTRKKSELTGAEAIAWKKAQAGAPATASPAAKAQPAATPAK